MAKSKAKPAAASLPPTAADTMVITEPLVIMFQNGDDGGVSCHLYPGEHCQTHEHYGMLICDLVRHVALAFDVDEDAVWHWVDAERDDPTTDIREMN